MSITLILICFIVGVLIGAVGIGGVLLVPSLYLLAGIDVHEAVPACTLSYLATGVEGTDAVTNLTPVTRLGRYPDTRRNPAAARAIAIPGKAWIMEGPDTSQVMVTGKG